MIVKTNNNTLIWSSRQTWHQDEKSLKTERLKFCQYVRGSFLNKIIDMDSGNNNDLMRREFLAQDFSLFSRSLKSLLISTICKSYVYSLYNQL